MYKSGDIFLVHNGQLKSFNDLAAHLIRWATRSYWNHVAIIVESEGELMIYEAVGRGCIITKTIEQYLMESDNGVRVHRHIPNEPNEVFYERFFETYGKRYDWKSTFWIHAIKIVIKRWLGHTGTHAKDRFYCSELAAYLLDLPNWWTVIPKDLARLYLSSSEPR